MGDMVASHTSCRGGGGGVRVVGVGVEGAQRECKAGARGFAWDKRSAGGEDVGQASRTSFLKGMMNMGGREEGGHQGDSGGEGGGGGAMLLRAAGVGVSEGMMSPARHEQARMEGRRGGPRSGFPGRDRGKMGRCRGGGGARERQEQGHAILWMPTIEPYRVVGIYM